MIIRDYKHLIKLLHIDTEQISVGKWNAKQATMSCVAEVIPLSLLDNTLFMVQYIFFDTISEGGGPELPCITRIKNESANIVNKNDDNERLFCWKICKLFVLWWNNVTTKKIRNSVN